MLRIFNEIEQQLLLLNQDISKCYEKVTYHIHLKF